MPQLTDGKIFELFSNGWTKNQIHLGKRFVNINGRKVLEELPCTTNTQRLLGLYEKWNDMSSSYQQGFESEEIEISKKTTHDTTQVFVPGSFEVEPLYLDNVPLHVKNIQNKDIELIIEAFKGLIREFNSTGKYGRPRITIRIKTIQKWIEDALQIVGGLKWR